MDKVSGKLTVFFEEYIQKICYSLQFSPAVATVEKQRFVNPKRMQRNVKCQLKQKGIGTKAQQALKLQQEQCKIERIEKRSEQKQAAVERRFELKQQKRREKHKGH